MSGTIAVDNSNNFTSKHNKRWDELEAAKERDQNRQDSDGSRQLEWSDEQKFAPYFAAANKKIDELVSDARQKKDNIDNELDKSIKEVVQNLANTLKALGFPVNRIANEIVHQLKGRGGSRSWIQFFLMSIRIRLIKRMPGSGNVKSLRWRSKRNRI